MFARKIEPSSFFFASSSAIYGDLGQSKTAEDSGLLLPNSNYGAMKLASEAIISSQANILKDKVCIFRYPNVVGNLGTHGVVFDFHKKLTLNKNHLDVLLQCKPFLHVDDLIDALSHISELDGNFIELFNIGPDDAGCNVRYIAEKAAEAFGDAPTTQYEKGERGWDGDIPFYSYDVSKLKKSGFSVKLSSKEAIDKAIENWL